MRYSAVTIKDLARELGVSTSTVSRALRDSYEINPETKKMVMECAKRMNYQPNPIALSLKERKSRSIGVIVSEIANSFFSKAINGIESAAHERGYNVIIAQTQESYRKELSILEFLASRSIDGLLISIATETRNMEHFAALHARGLPLVFFDRITEDINTHTVVADNFQGSYEATSHLIGNGYRRIAHVTNSKNLSITQERLKGYRQALKDHQIPADKSYVQYCHHGGMIHSELENAFNNLMELRPLPDAIFAGGDKLTTGCLKILRSRGIKIPEEMALAGFSNSDLAEVTEPPLTVVKQPAFEMGRTATELLLELIESKRPVEEFEKRKFATRLLVHRSSIRPALTSIG
ncbi:LacI family transcriptional regulator [Anseongella ginsenosidimutans]|uniref:LacI family transcriptional regulator n=1 Tax=Anseongella ginsenosidimutans TaxID=496056 RepID=A0A4R3KLG7_9SPHI|nr:LacI family DNA-binding transcriptional regulator [Anseongella ginsenosidimutans]QEC53781.1 LacI family transcriptional regulator [Anseongella ginsenosidimutans]TCS84921.1 LacI family transcriptional regulator [Anseongella ginsenosidimutans]